MAIRSPLSVTSVEEFQCHQFRVHRPVQLTVSDVGVHAAMRVRKPLLSGPLKLAVELIATSLTAPRRRRVARRGRMVAQVNCADKTPKEKVFFIFRDTESFCEFVYLCPKRRRIRLNRLFLNCHVPFSGSRKTT